MYIHILESC